MNSNRNRYRRMRRTAAFAAAMFFTTGCAAVTPLGKLQTSATDPPRVQNCGIVAISSPSKFACNGKVYTSFQLAELRDTASNKVLVTGK